MKIIILLLGLVILMATASKTDCFVTIPDANYKTALLTIVNLDANTDGETQCSEALTLTGTLNIGSQSISDLTGIEAFTNITILICNNNSLTSLDVSAAHTTLIC